MSKAIVGILTGGVAMTVAVVTGVVTMATQLLKMAVSTVIGGILTVAAVVVVIVIVVVILSGCSSSESSEVGETVGATNSPSPVVLVNTPTTEPLASPAPTATTAPQSNGGQPTPRAEMASPTAVVVTPTTAPTTEPPDSSAPTATTVSPPPRAETATARPERKTANPIATSTPPPTVGPTREPTPEREYEIVSLLPPDAIPSISNPKFVSAEEAGDDYGPDELVLGVEIDGDARAYSIPLLSRHEIVNDVVGGKPIAVTW